MTVSSKVHRHHQVVPGKASRMGKREKKDKTTGIEEQNTDEENKTEREYERK